MTTALQTKRDDSAQIIETVIAKGDLSRLTVDERNSYYLAVCRSVGLNPLTRPLEYITLSGRMVLYARRDATDQLRSIHKVSITDMVESNIDGVYIVTVKGTDGNGRTDMAKGAVNIANLKGEALANAMMKAETKAKRRVTLSLCGLGLLDETEVQDIPQREVKQIETGELITQNQADELEVLTLEIGGERAKELKKSTLEYFEIASFSDLPANKYHRVVAAIEKKRMPLT